MSSGLNSMQTLTAGTVSKHKLKALTQERVHKAMERFIKQCDKTSMKTAILKQEEVFRHQVHELHKLYRTQKILMRDMKKSKTHIQGRDTDEEMRPRQVKRKHHRRLDPAEEYVGNDVDVDIGDESEIELTLATGSNRRKREDASHTSDSGTSAFSSSSTDSGGVKLVGHELGQFRAVASDRAIDIEDGKRKERLNPLPWSWPCLSLKIT